MRACVRVCVRETDRDGDETMADFAYHTPSPMANERWLSSRRCELNLEPNQRKKERMTADDGHLKSHLQ